MGASRERRLRSTTCCAGNYTVLSLADRSHPLLARENIAPSGGILAVPY
jgi:hypothetical protein